MLGLQPLVPAESQPQHDVYRAIGGDDGKARPERHVEIEAVMDHQHGRGLPEHGEPAQAHQRVEPHAAHGVLLLLDAQIRHPVSLAGSSRVVAHDTTAKLASPATTRTNDSARQHIS
jgi:hypothetical protein